MTEAISLIIPAYNEAARLRVNLPKVFEFLAGYGSPSELIVVDDGSADETAAVAEEAFERAGNVEVRLLQNGVNRGKGYSVRAGLLESVHPIAFFSDADVSTPIQEIDTLASAIETGADVAFGSRALNRDLIGVHQPWKREQGGKIFNLIVRLATGLPFRDTQCGFKAFRMAVCRPLIESAQIDRFGFDVELLYLARLAGLKMAEVPVRWDHCEGSKVSFLQDSFRMLSEVNRIRQMARNGVYAKATAATKASSAMGVFGSGT